MIKTGLLGFEVMMHLSSWEQYIQSAEVEIETSYVMHCDNKPLQDQSWYCNFITVTS